MPATVQRNLRVHLLRLAKCGASGTIRLPVQGGICTCIKAPAIPASAATWMPLGNEVVSPAQGAVLDIVLSILKDLAATNWDGTLLIDVVAGEPGTLLWEFTDNLLRRQPAARAHLRAVT